MSQHDTLKLLEELGRPVRPVELEQEYARQNGLPRIDPGHHGRLLMDLKNLINWQLALKLPDGRYVALSVVIGSYIESVAVPLR